MSHTVSCLPYSSSWHYFRIDFIMITEVCTCISVFKSIMLLDHSDLVRKPLLHFEVFHGLIGGMHHVT